MLDLFTIFFNFKIIFFEASKWLKLTLFSSALSLSSKKQLCAIGGLWSQQILNTLRDKGFDVEEIFYVQSL